jgi:predicted AAA+ superfamily ATPase
LEQPLLRKTFAGRLSLLQTVGYNSCKWLTENHRFGVKPWLLSKVLNDEVPQWFPELRDKLRFRKAPKRILTDPSIAVSALKVRAGELKRDPRTLGALFENLCLRDLLIYAEAVDAKLSHYHDGTGLEVDVILERDTKWAALEIKLSAHRIEEGIRALARLSAKVQAKDAPPPAFLGVITSGGPSYTREDGIHVIPVDCLGP